MQPSSEATGNNAQSGLSDTAAGAIAYITILPAILFMVLEPYNRNSYVRFHAWQSIFFCIFAVACHIVLGLIPVVGWILSPIVALGFFIFWLMLVIKASKGIRYKAPFIGNFAEQQAK